MNKIPEIVLQAWENREGPPVLTTVDSNGLPNAIYATCVYWYDEQTIVIADNYFNKTRENIKSGSKGSLLFITSERTSYQLKGTFTYVQEGPIFDFMKANTPARLPGHAAAAIVVEEIYSGANKLL